MKKWLGLLACVGLVAFSVSAQGGNTPLAEVGGGYTFRSFAAPGAPNFNSNGWFANVEFNLNPWIGISTDADFTKKTLSTSTNFFPGPNDFSSVMVGPQLYLLGHHRIAPFFKVQLGLAHYSNTEPKSTGCGNFCTLTDGSFAFGAGAGVDLSVVKYLAIRVGEIDYEQTRLFEPADTGLGNQNNYKFKAGVIFRFGQR